MQDLISREAVMEIIEGKRLENVAKDSVIHSDYFEGAYDACVEIKERIKKLKSQNQWISVEEMTLEQICKELGREIKIVK